MEILLPRLDGGRSPELGNYLDGIVGTRLGGPADQYDDWLPDPLYYEDVRLDRNKTLLGLNAVWSQGKIAVPSRRSLGVTRSGGTPLLALVLPLDLRIMAHAVIADFAPRVSALLLRDKVLGFGFREDRVPRFETPGERAELLEDAARTLFNLGLGDSITVVDVSGFLGNIRIEQLEQQLRRSGVLDEQITFLRKIVAVSATGLPTIDDAFAFLYNIYLTPVDDALARAEVNFFRYRDEYFLLSGEGVTPVEQALAALGLSAHHDRRELSPDDAEYRLQERALAMTGREREGEVLEELIVQITADG